MGSAIAGFNLADEAFQAMFRAFDPDLDGRLGLAEYMAMTLFLRSASATFTAFDTQRQNRISLDFNQAGPISSFLPTRITFCMDWQCPLPVLILLSA